MFSVHLIAQFCFILFVSPSFFFSAARAIPLDIESSHAAGGNGTSSVLLSRTPLSRSQSYRHRGGLTVKYKRWEDGPAINTNFPDPCMLWADGKWYAFGTETSLPGRTPGSMVQHIPVAISSDFHTWNLLNGVDALPWAPSWSNTSVQQTWAPDISQMDDGSYVMYYTAPVAGKDLYRCIGVATSLTVLGPYIPLNETFACPGEQGGAIDASGFKDWSVKGDWTPPSPSNSSTNSSGDGFIGANPSARDATSNNSWTGGTEWSEGGSGGTRYVVYKVDGNSIGHGNLQGTGDCGNTAGNIVPTPIMIQEVESDGITKKGQPVQILDNAGVSDQGIVEAPSAVKTADGNYILFFSSGCYNTPGYTVSYATASSAMGPYERQSPLFKTGDDGLVGPGGMDIHWDAQHMVFHGDLPPYQNATERGMWLAMIGLADGKVTV